MVISNYKRAVALKYMYSVITGSIAKAGSAVVTGLTQKFYLETNLVQVQIYMEDLPQVVKSLEFKDKEGQACRVEKLIKQYKDLVLADEYVQVKTAPDTFECFPIHTSYTREGKKIYLIKMKKYSDSFMEIPEDAIFLGVHAPLCPVKCGSISVVSFETRNKRRRWTERQPDSGSALQNFYNAWANVEMLKLEMEAVLKDIEVGEALEF